MKRREGNAAPQFKNLLAIFLSFFVLGCASSIRSIVERPVVENSIGDHATGMSLSADRRNVLIIGVGENYYFCAEPPPDVAIGVTTKTSASLDASGNPGSGEGGEISLGAELDDEYSSAVVKLAERTVLLDVYRTSTFALCQYYLNGAYDSVELQEAFEKLNEEVLSILKVYAHSGESNGGVSLDTSDSGDNGADSNIEPDASSTVDPSTTASRVRDPISRDPQKDRDAQDENDG